MFRRDLHLQTDRFRAFPQRRWQFESDLLSERVKSGLAAARARGKKLGRQPGQRPKSDRLAPKGLNAIAGGRSYRWIARDLGISKNTVTDIVKRHWAIPYQRRISPPTGLDPSNACRGRLSEMTENLIVILVISPRIKQLNLKIHEILHIPGHEDQLMLNGYRCDLGIGCGWGGPVRSPSPMRRPQTAAVRPSKGRTRPSSCRARSCSIHLSNRSRRSCSLTFRAPRTSSPMV